MSIAELIEFTGRQREAVQAQDRADCHLLVAAWHAAEAAGDDLVWWHLRRLLNERIRLARARQGYPLHDPDWVVPWRRPGGGAAVPS
jgi:hypothetical protein